TAGDYLPRVRLTSSVTQDKGSHDVMSAAGESAQHAPPVRLIPGFTEDLSVDLDDGICAEDPGPGMFPCYVPGFLLGHAQRVRPWQLPGPGGFGRITGDDNKGDPNPLQQLPTARGGGGENEWRSGAWLFHLSNLIVPSPSRSLLRDSLGAVGERGLFSSLPWGEGA